MTEDIARSVYLITSRKNGKFGSGFVIGCLEDSSLIVTCAHVVNDVGGVENIVVHEMPTLLVEIVADGEEDGIDLAILKVTGFPATQPLPLSYEGREGVRGVVAGFRRHSPSTMLLRRVNVRLGKRVVVQYRGKARQINGWDLIIDDTFDIAEGNSGSPVITETGRVIAIATHAMEQGRKGTAIGAFALNILVSQAPQSPSNRLTLEHLFAIMPSRTVDTSAEHSSTPPKLRLVRVLVHSFSPHLCQLEELLRMESSYWTLAGIRKPDATSFHVAKYLHGHKKAFDSLAAQMRQIEDQVADQTYSRQLLQIRMGQIMKPLREKVNSIVKATALLTEHPMEITLSMAIGNLKGKERELLSSFYRNSQEDDVGLRINQYRQSTEFLSNQIHRFCVVTIEGLQESSASNLDVTVEIEPDWWGEELQN